MIQLRLKKNLLTASGPLTLDAEFQVAQGEFVTLFGQSGVGKTTLLRAIAGLTAPDGGTIKVGGETWFDAARGISVPPQKRKVGFVFQDYALFPNMTVQGNLEFALEHRRDKKYVDELLELMGLDALRQRKPGTLSCGQQQRVALARALTGRPRLLLLDEPFSALDSETRLRLQDEIIKIHRLLGITTLLVSHDISEVFKLSDRVLMLEAGRIARSGRPAEIFTDRKISGKFQFTGEVLEIEPTDVVYAVSVLVGNQIVSVIATSDEVKHLRIGDKVLLVSKAFNPMLMKTAPHAGDSGEAVVPAAGQGVGERT